MIYLIKFDQQGFRQDTYPLEEKDPRIQELLKEGFEKVSEENYNKLLGNIDGKIYRKTPRGFEPYTYSPSEKDKLSQKKALREEELENLKVQVDGMVFDADEISQNRISRILSTAYTLNQDIDTTFKEWVLADNTISKVSIRQLSAVLEKASEKTSELWLKPYK
jgi:hypothetical protein